MAEEDIDYGEWHDFSPLWQLSAGTISSSESRNDAQQDAPPEIERQSQEFDIHDWINLSPTPELQDPIVSDFGSGNDTQQDTPTVNGSPEHSVHSGDDLQELDLQGPSSTNRVGQATDEHDNVVGKNRFRAIEPRPNPYSPPLEFRISTPSTQGKLPIGKRKRRCMNLEGDSYPRSRQLGACAHCRLHKIKCSCSEHCESCVKKHIPQELCCRTRVKDLINYRLGLATKFIDAYEGSIVRWEPNGQKREVQLWYGLRSKFTFEVMEYVPQQEIIDLWWRSPSGWQKLTHTPFAIRSTQDIDPVALDEYTFEQIPLLLDQIEGKYQNQPTTAPNTPDIYSDSKGSTMWLRTMRFSLATLEKSPSTPQILRDAVLLWAYTFLQYHALWQFTEDNNHNKLGMSQLALKNHDCDTLTRFSGATPPPILLRQQIHACIEGRMADLEISLKRALHRSYEKVSKSAPGADWVTLYLTTWVYLSVLEEIAWDAGRWNNLLHEFKWPLDQSPDTNCEQATHSARTVAAHYRMASRGEKLKDLCECQLAAGRNRGHARTQAPLGRDSEDQSMQDYFREVQSFADAETSNLDRRKNADFQADDIRSLEMKFVAMMISGLSVYGLPQNRCFGAVIGYSCLPEKF